MQLFPNLILILRHCSSFVSTFVEPTKVKPKEGKPCLHSKPSGTGPHCQYYQQGNYKVKEKKNV